MKTNFIFISLVLASGLRCANAQLINVQKTASPGYAVSAVNSITASSATNLTLNGGSSGSSLALGQGGAVKAFTFTAPATSLASWTTTGAFTSHPAQTFTNTSTAGSGTAASAVFHSFAVPTLAATNASVTTTDAATVYIGGAPTAGTNQTITNPWGLWNVGRSRFDGITTIGGTSILNTGEGVLQVTGVLGVQAAGGGFGNGLATGISPGLYTPVTSGGTVQIVGFGNGSRGGYLSGFQNGGGSIVWSFSNLASAGTVYTPVTITGSTAGLTTGGLSVTTTTPSTLPTNGALIVGGGGGFGGALNIAGKIITYNNLATAGNGLVSIQGAGRATAQTAANASVATYTVGASDASFTVSANVLVTTSSAEAFTVTCDYTDEGNTARTITLNFQLVAGTIGTGIAFANGAVPYEGLPVHIRSKAATAITVKTAAGGTYTGCTYNVEGVISKLQ